MITRLGLLSTLSLFFLFPSSVFAIDSTVLGGNGSLTSCDTANGAIFKPAYSQSMSNVDIYYKYSYGTTTADYTLKLWRVTSTSTAFAFDWFVQDAILINSTTITDEVIIPKTTPTALSFPLTGTLSANEYYALSLHSSNTSGDNSTTTGCLFWTASSTSSTADEFYGSLYLHYDETGYEPFERSAYFPNTQPWFTTESNALNSSGFLIEIDEVGFADADQIYASGCSTNSNAEYTRGCYSATSTTRLLTQWTFTTLYAESHTIHAQLTDFETGNTPLGNNPDIYNYYYDFEDLIYHGESNFITAKLTFEGVATTSGKYNLSICAEPNDFLNGAYDCAYMTVCVGTVSDADCFATAGQSVFGGNIPKPTVACSVTDVECILKKLFIPDPAFMRTVAGDATSTIANSWPLGYFYREWEDFNNATATDFIISLDMSRFDSGTGIGIPNTTASGTPVGSINLTQAVTGASLLVDPDDTNNLDLIDVVESFIYAFLWIFIAWRMMYGAYPALTEAYGAGKRYDMVRYNHDRAYVDKVDRYNNRKRV